MLRQSGHPYIDTIQTYYRGCNTPEAVIEWSMRWTPAATGEPEVLLGSEWYLFEDGRISEIRSQYAVYQLRTVNSWDNIYTYYQKKVK